MDGARLAGAQDPLTSPVHSQGPVRAHGERAAADFAQRRLSGRSVAELDESEALAAPGVVGGVVDVGLDNTHYAQALELVDEEVGALQG